MRSSIPVTKLLSRDETVTLLRARDCPRTADDLASGHAGPPSITVDGEQRYDWDEAYPWGRNREYMRPWDYHDRAEAVETAENPII
jgi:hypothetical protein